MIRLDNVIKRSIDYMKDFNCIGNQCTDNCCIGWTITIDKNTFKKYKSIKNNEILDFNNNISRIRKGYNDNVYGKMNTLDGRCSFLDEKNLCKIHSNLGHDLLCEVCSSYPRIYNMFGNELEYSGALSCPVVANLVLRRKQPLRFDESRVSESIKSGLYKIIIPKDNSDPFLTYYKDIRQLLITLFYMDLYNLYEKIMMSAILIKRIQEVISQKNVDLVPNIISDFIANDMANNSGAFESIPIKEGLQIQWLTQISALRFLISRTSEKFSKYYNEFLAGLEINLETDEKTSIQSYYEGLEIYNKWKKHNNILFENYLVHSIFQENLYENQSILNNYSKIIIKYNIIELMLIGICKTRGEMTDDLVIDFIQSFTKVINHNLKFSEAIDRFIEENNMSTLSHLSILSKRE